MDNWDIHGSPTNSPQNGQWRGALMFSLISAWTNGWVNNWDAGNLRRHPAHCDVTVMATVRTITVLLRHAGICGIPLRLMIHLNYEISFLSYGSQLLTRFKIVVQEDSKHTVVLCSKLRDNLSTEMGVKNERDINFTRFEINEISRGVI